MLEERYNSCSKFHGIRSYHAFIPKTSSTFIMKKVSTDSYEEIINLCEVQAIQIEQLNIGLYVNALYEDMNYYGIIEDISIEHNDIFVNFMSQQNLLYTWPARADLCWIPIQNILSIVNPLNIVSLQMYKF